MTDLPHAADVMNRVQELDNYISQSLDVLKSLQNTKKDADKILGSIAQLKDELGRREQDLSTYIKTLQLVSEKANVILSPILQAKADLEQLEKKLNEAVGGIPEEVARQIGTFADEVRGERKMFEDRLNESLPALRKDFESAVADLLRQQREITDSVTKQIKDLQQNLETQHSALQKLETTIKGQADKAEQLKKEDATLQHGIHDVKDLLEKMRQEFTESLKNLKTEQKKEFEGALSELNEKHIKILEKDDAQIKTALNGIIKKLSNVKFKKMLGLE